ncbi:hypothetical protein C8R47DRAFT_33622 [Mycena vitilis]|nr:hypothetical protein C8R47DRAFT_33622 [Mycena vitilis]
MHSPQASRAIPHRYWTPAPYESLGTASSNGARLHLPHDAPDHRRTIRGLCLPPLSQRPRQDWRPTSDALFTPPSHPYQPLPAELEPPSYGVPQYYPPTLESTVNDDYEDDSFDIAALADQYLDLSAHCSMSSRSSSPATDYTDNSDVPTRAAKRRRGDFLHLPTAASSDDGSGTDTDRRHGDHVGLSPFYHPSTPAHEAEPAHDFPVSYQRYQYHNLTSPAGPISDHPPPGILKFAEAPRKDGRSKRQALACLFCRERKIACGRPADGSPTKTCK